MFDFMLKEDSKMIKVNDMDNLIGKVELIDIREPYEYKNGSLKTAKNIPMEHILTNPDKYLSKDKTYYIMCHSGARSSRTTRELTRKGFNVINIEGGMISYTGTKRI
ncbi:MAG: rhodanese-like domain-containing protein [Mobilitalea sp.]